MNSFARKEGGGDRILRKSHSVAAWAAAPPPLSFYVFCCQFVFELLLFKL